MDVFGIDIGGSGIKGDGWNIEVEVGAMSNPDLRRIHAVVGGELLMNGGSLTAVTAIVTVTAALAADASSA